MSTATALIGVDWGSSNLRVFRMGADGAVLDRRADGRGASSLAPHQFADVLTEVAADWLAEDLPVVVCGMAGARGRWLEAPYAPCPAGLDDIASYAVTPADAPEVRILPGVAVWRDGCLDDVMRGEETQLFGLGVGFDRVIAPGTHSKWARLESGRIVDFSTHMTGELFAALSVSPSFVGGGRGERMTRPSRRVFWRGWRTDLWGRVCSEPVSACWPDAWRRRGCRTTCPAC